MLKQRIFIEGEYYHICNKSISGFNIFKDPKNARRILTAIDFYNNKQRKSDLSNYLRSYKNKQKNLNILLPKKDSIIKLLAYCLMPDHYHLLIRVLTDYSISKYISDVENSFSRYFNIKFKRKGPIWQSRFRSVEIKTDEQLLHVSRYIHLNPVTDYLVDKPEDWEKSSYRDYIYKSYYLKKVFNEITINEPQKYKKFCEDQIDYQRKLKKIKRLTLE
jgi:putative transposase